MSEFPVYIIYSRWSLPQIDSFISHYGEAGYLRVVYNREGRETNRTISILHPATFEKLAEEGFHANKKSARIYGNDFRVVPFKLREKNLPSGDKSGILFIPVPKELVSNDTQIRTIVTNKLKHIASWSIIEENSWAVNIPLKSREKGGAKNGCFISFRNDVTIEQIAMVRILLTDTYWSEQPTDDSSPFRCYWGRNRKSRKKKVTLLPDLTQPVLQ